MNSADSVPLAPDEDRAARQHTTAGKHILLWMGAVICLVTAFVILVSLGLPERAEYTGVMIPGELPIAPEINAVAPPFELDNLNSQPVKLAALRGHPVIVNFWATWCEPCRIEMPDIEAVFQSYQQHGLRVLAVNLGETPQLVQGWVDTFGLTFDVLLDRNQQIAALYQLRGQPSTYVISPEGIITQIFFGPTNQDSLKAAIAPFFPSG
jgi:peroxiredoxin